MDRKYKGLLKRQNLLPSSPCIGLTAHSKAPLLFSNGCIPLVINLFLCNGLLIVGVGNFFLCFFFLLLLFIFLCLFFGSWESIVGIVTCYRVNSLGFGSQWRRDFPEWPAGPPSLLYSGYWVKWVRRGVDHIPLASTEFEEYCYAITTPLGLHGLSHRELYSLFFNCVLTAKKAVFLHSSCIYSYCRVNILQCLCSAQE